MEISDFLKSDTFIPPLLELNENFVCGDNFVRNSEPRYER